MTFNSIPFALFLLLVVLLYNAVPRNWRASLLTVSSYVFYAINSEIYAVFLAFVTFLTYYGGRIIKRQIERKKAFLVIGIVLTLSFLVFFKYTNFAITIWNDFSCLWNGSQLNLLHIIVPVGISFYTFVAVGYMIDIYRGKIEPERNIIRYALFLSYFPAILSGPIERSDTLLPQLLKLERTQYENARDGFFLLLWGLFYKVVIADRLALCSNAVFADVHSFQGLSLLAGSLAFTFQIYFDFAGYTCMALGVSLFFNIRLTNNFNKPYLAVSLTDFWRRWHISLTSWFRDYLYIPLGGNRVKSSRWALNVMIVFLVSGLWHGAFYTFIIWGGLHGLVQIIERFIIPDKNIRTGVERGKNGLIRCLRVFVTFCVVSAAWVFFRASSVSDAWYVITGASNLFDYFFGGLLGDNGTSVMLGMSLMDTILSILFVLFAALMEMFVGSKSDGLFFPKYITHKRLIIKWGAVVVLSLVILWFGKLGISEFVYFNF